MDRVALITGVAGGIGSAAAALFHEAGWRVVGTDLREESVPGVDHFIAADLADPDAPQRIVEEAQRDFGRLDALINNAAMMLGKAVLETTAEECDRMMAVNVRAVLLLMRHAHPALNECPGGPGDPGGRGAVVNISSVHAMATSPNIAAYAASKGAVLALTRAAALEFAPEVRVNAVLPGAVRTPMLTEGVSRGEGDQGGLVNERVRALGERHALGRVGRPAEIARAILFLADGEQSSYITGQSLVIDGGCLARLSTE